MTPGAALDPVDPAFIACPFPAYQALRSEAPVTFVDHGKGFWFVTRHDLVGEVVTNPTVFSSRVGSLSTAQPSPDLLAKMEQVIAEGISDVPTLLTADRPVHTRNRRLVSRAFTPRAVAVHESMVRETCRDLIRAWDVTGPVDFVRSFAIPLPVRVIAHALAVPERVDDFKRWSDGAVALIGSDLTDDEVLAAMRANNELSQFLLEEIAERRSRPGNDLLSTLVQASLTDDELSDLDQASERQLRDEEIISIVRQLLVAGNETTTNLLTQMMVRFGEEPHWWQELRDQPELIDGAAEELLRLVSPSGVNQRRTTREVELGGVTIPAGADVLVVYLSANHDERVFPEPEEFDPRRSNGREHLAFGKGIHFCVGASLARMEIRTAIQELTRAVTSFALVDPDDLAWNRSFMLRAIQRLPLRPVLT